MGIIQSVTFVSGLFHLINVFRFVYIVAGIRLHSSMAEFCSIAWMDLILFVHHQVTDI